MTHATLPTAPDLEQLLSTLFRTIVTTKAAPAILPGTKVYVATYVDGDGALECLLVCEIAVAAALSAVLTVMPATTVNDAIRTGRLTPEQLESTREVANIVASIFRDRGVRLSEVFSPGTALPPAVAALRAKPGQRLDLALEIPGYRGGKLALIGS